jgi:hypothetical protein
MKKQTAVEWLVIAITNNMTNNLSSEIGALLVELFDEAKAMEKEQIQDAFYYGIEVDESKVHSPYRAAEDYFKQNY